MTPSTHQCLLDASHSQILKLVGRRLLCGQVGFRGTLFPAERRRATFHERLDAFLHIFAAEDAIRDLGNVIDRSGLTGLDNAASLIT